MYKVLYFSFLTAVNKQIKILTLQFSNITFSFFYDNGSWLYYIKQTLNV